MIIKAAPSLETTISICNLLNLIRHLMLINLVYHQTRVVDGGGSLSVDHCYSDIGCFPLSAEFYHPRHRPFNVRPWHRRRINTRFHLFSQKHLNGFELKPWNRINLLQSGFNPMLETKIIIPGWLDNIKRALWVRRMKDSFLWLWQPVNIVVVHWRNFTPYTIATANTRVVGAELANLIRSIEHELNYDRSYYHVIGHSLGAHIGGYCGDRMPGLGRITALDPARPFFQHMPKSVRLDRGDARFIDAIHSDFTPENAIFLFMSFGMTTPVGHLDFYPNGPPLLQPGCLRDTILSVRNGILRGLEHSSLSVAFLEAVRYLTACDHQRSHEWFIESITNRRCVFVGVRCNEFEGLINGRCTCDNSRSACAIMGIHADQMYLNNAHQDLWPLGGGQAEAGAGVRFRRRPSETATLNLEQSQGVVPPSSSSPSDKINQPSKGQIYSRLKQKAQELRRPPMPTAQPEATVYDNDNDDYLDPDPDHLEPDEDLDSSSIQDLAFVNYLRTNLAANSNRGGQILPHPLQRPTVASRQPSQSHHGHISTTNSMPALNLAANQVPYETMTNELTDVTDDFKRRQDDNADDDDNDNDDLGLGLSHLFGGGGGDNSNLNHQPRPLNDHPRLLSDIDRDIESWYEDNSRWYLKTNSRPSYCVNQYQVLVFLGPLKTTTGHRHVRANLIISIIGSRGQLMNQRFVPRSSNLDSFTMQPFFIILEGTYSLGNIVSVAIGWEARHDPDPVQATISFQSNLLEGVQSMLPTYKAKHPWLSQTIKYDHTGGFKWHGAPTNVYGLRPNNNAASSMISLERRLTRPAQDELSSGPLRPDVEGCTTVSGGSGGQCQALDHIRSHSDHKHGHKKVRGTGSSSGYSNLLLEELLAFGKGSLDDYLEGEIDYEESGDGEDEKNGGQSDRNGASAAIIGGGGKSVDGADKQTKFDRMAPMDELKMLGSENFVITKSSHINNNLLPLIENQMIHKQPQQQNTNNNNYNRMDPIALVNDIYVDSQREITAKLHNFGIHQDHADEDSIVVSQVVVSPLQATYGKGGPKTGKIFCPPHQNYRLQKERTVRLRPNLLGKCHDRHQHHHPPHLGQPIRVY